MNGGTEFRVCEDTAAMCTPQHGGDPSRPKFCEELIMVTGSLTCGQPDSLASNIGWCCGADDQCGEHYPNCIEPECGPGMHYEGGACACDEDWTACFGPLGLLCCPAGSVCRSSTCVVDPGSPSSFDWGWLLNMVNMARQSHDQSSRDLQRRGAPAPGPVGDALLQIAAVNGFREAARRAFVDGPVDAAYQTNVVAPEPSLPTLVSGPGLDARATRALAKLLAAEAKGFAEALASARSLARVRGALGQQDVKQAGKRARAAAKLAKRAAKALGRLPKLRAKAVEALTEAGVAEVDTSTDEVLDFQAGVQADGLPGDLAALLLGLGADADDLERVRDSVLDGGVATGGPALIAPLADAAQTADLETIALELEEFAKSARRSPLDAVAGAP